MHDMRTILTLLQHGDSNFPAGGFAFSWGVEGLEIDGHLPRGRAALQGFVVDQLAHRWDSMDRVLLRRAFAADIDGIEEVDHETEALTLSAEMRQGSRRAGRALIGVHARTRSRTVMHTFRAGHNRMAVGGWAWVGLDWVWLELLLGSS